MPGFVQDLMVPVLPQKAFRYVVNISFEGNKRLAAIFAIVSSYFF